MAKKKARRSASKPTPASTPARGKVDEFRHKQSKRKNHPPAKLAAEASCRSCPRRSTATARAAPPSLRFDETGRADRLPELLQTARTRPLSEDEARTLAEDLRREEPWLEWSGKREQHSFAVDPVALHIHERSARRQY